MKRIWLLAFAMGVFAQSIEIEPLSQEETAKLVQLNGVVSAALKAETKAWEDFCKAEQEIKRAHQAKETSGFCGNGGWSSEPYATSTSGTATTLSGAPRYRWDFSKDYKYLVRIQ